MYFTLKKGYAIIVSLIINIKLYQCMSDESKVSRQEITYYLNKEGGASQPLSYS